MSPHTLTSPATPAPPLPPLGTTAVLAPLLPTPIPTPLLVAARGPLSSQEAGPLGPAPPLSPLLAQSRGAPPPPGLGQQASKTRRGAGRPMTSPTLDQRSPLVQWPGDLHRGGITSHPLSCNPLHHPHPHLLPQGQSRQAMSHLPT